MKKFVMGTMMLLAIAGTPLSAQPGRDGYRFTDKQFEHLDIQVKVVVFATKNEWIAHLHSKNFGDDQIFGYSVISPSKNICTIYMLDPKVSYEPDAIGHEFLHCVYGQFHPRQDSSTTTMFSR